MCVEGPLQPCSLPFPEPGNLPAFFQKPIGIGLYQAASSDRQHMSVLGQQEGSGDEGRVEG